MRVACLWARKLGLPIGDIVLAHNANRTVPDFLDSGEWQPRAEHRDAGLGHGRRQSEQHGAPARAVSGRATSCASAVSAVLGDR